MVVDAGLGTKDTWSNPAAVATVVFTAAVEAVELPDWIDGTEATAWAGAMD